MAKEPLDWADKEIVISNCWHLLNKNKLITSTMVVLCQLLHLAESHKTNAHLSSSTRCKTFWNNIRCQRIAWLPQSSTNFKWIRPEARKSPKKSNYTFFAALHKWHTDTHTPSSATGKRKLSIYSFRPCILPTAKFACKELLFSSNSSTRGRVGQLVDTSSNSWVQTHPYPDAPTHTRPEGRRETRLINYIGLLSSDFLGALAWQESTPSARSHRPIRPISTSSLLPRVGSSESGSVEREIQVSSTRNQHCWKLKREMYRPGSKLWKLHSELAFITKNNSAEKSNF